jgi:hypothetical protein
LSGVEINDDGLSETLFDVHLVHLDLGPQHIDEVIVRIEANLVFILVDVRE